MDQHQYNPLAASEPVATSPDMTRQVATGDDFISIKEVQRIFQEHGRSITERTLQRYCEKQQLDGQKRITGEGEKWFVRESSVFTRLKELEEFDRLRTSRQVATTTDTSLSVADVKQDFLVSDKQRQETTENVSGPVAFTQPSHPTPDDMPRPVATSRDVSHGNETVQQQFILEGIERERRMYELMLEQYKDRIEDLVKDKSALQSDKEMLVEQLRSKDKQIDRFFESEHETKTLAGRLQSLMSAIWPSTQGTLNRRYVPMHDALESGLGDERGEQR